MGRTASPHPTASAVVPAQLQQGWPTGMMPSGLAGNTPSSLPVSSESGRYSTQLLHEGRGFPMYVPGPHSSLSAQYQRRGIDIGDLGRLTSEGIFDFFFNIFLPVNHPINANVPEDFVPLSPYDRIDVVHHEFDPGNYVRPSFTRSRSLSVKDYGASFSGM
ncbi:hypothetical protein B0H19DRAFT_466789 [Mycena capillaripes]|nr:hypothetical protein B0H19DRAFT_466789 [Mycena capillaripes]